MVFIINDQIIQNGTNIIKTVLNLQTGVLCGLIYDLITKVVTLKEPASLNNQIIMPAFMESNHLEMTEILLKGRKTLTRPSIHHGIQTN